MKANVDRGDFNDAGNGERLWKSLSTILPFPVSARRTGPTGLLIGYRPHVQPDQGCPNPLAS
jgi:hypothetical protein